MTDTFIQITKASIAQKFYSVAPGRLQYALHKRRFRRNIEAWIDAPCFMLHVPKCGGKSIAAALNLPDPGHTIISDMPAEIRQKLSKKPCIVVVRDPIDRIVSTFKFAHRHIAEGRNRTFAGLINSNDNDINDFIEQNLTTHLRDTRHFFRDASSFVDAAKAVGMQPELVDFKTLEKGCRQFFAKYQIHVDEIPRINVSDARSGLNLSLSREAKEKVASLYQRDVALYKLAHQHEPEQQ
ncbi:sulfotransferase family 2 domain-containing protein [Planktotalea sp.]|uniref:sulfotransferase family 2 domain-containing protein n=1 Tax=Planktotalea sp. TaxID=2029877 RepID=UPI0035C7E143